MLPNIAKYIQWALGKTKLFYYFITFFPFISAHSHLKVGLRTCIYGIDAACKFERTNWSGYFLLFVIAKD